MKGEDEIDEEDDYDYDTDWYLDDGTGKLTKGCTWNGSSNYQVCMEFCKSVLSAYIFSVCACDVRCLPHSFSTLSFLCVWICVCVSLYTCMCTFLCACGEGISGHQALGAGVTDILGDPQRPNRFLCVCWDPVPVLISLSCLQPLYLIFWDVSLEPRAHCLVSHWLVTSRDPPLSAAPVLGSRMLASASAFLCGCWGLNLGPQAWMTIVCGLSHLSSPYSFLKIDFVVLWVILS